MNTRPKPERLVRKENAPSFRGYKSGLYVPCAEDDRNLRFAQGDGRFETDPVTQQSVGHSITQGFNLLARAYDNDDPEE